MVCSPWLAMITFFFGYILHNSVQLYKRPSVDPSLTDFNCYHRHGCTWISIQDGM
jgi:hypothetical protein